MEKKILAALGWLFGILLIVIGAAALFESILAGLCLILAGIVLLPPLSTWLEPYYIPVTAWTRGIAFIILSTAYGQFMSAAEVEQQREAEEAKQQALREDFRTNRDSIEGRVKELIADSAFRPAQALANRYLDAGVSDSTLEELKAKAVKAEKKLQRARREKRLANKVQSVPASHLQENVKIYSQLVQLDPENATYQQKLQHYEDRLKFVGPRPEPSAWDGSYRPVESYLEPRLHDPGSLEWQGCSSPELVQERGWRVYCEYRANNAFGAKVLNAATFIIRRGQVVSMSEVTP